MTRPHHSPCMIIGAGIHGLSAAYHLALQLTAKRLPRLRRRTVYAAHECPTHHINQEFLSRLEKNTTRAVS